MTNQEKKKILQQYRSAGREEQRLEHELAEWRARAEKVTASYSKAPGGNGDGRSFENTMLKIAELQDRLNSQYAEMVDLRERIDKAIGAVESATLRELLKLRYVSGDTWEQIAKAMNYDVRWIYVLHGKALSAIKISTQKKHKKSSL